MHIVTMVSVPLSKKALERLKKLQKDGESISDVIVRLADMENHPDPFRLKKLESSLESTDVWGDIEKKIYASRLIPRD